MAISFQTITDNTVYRDLVYNTLGSNGYEGTVYWAYADSIGIATIGIGFNLQDEAVLKNVVKVLGPDPYASGLTPEQRAREQYWYDAIREVVSGSYSSSDVVKNALDTLMQLRAVDTTDTVVKTHSLFQFNNEPELRQAFDNIIPIYEKRVNDWLGTGFSVPDSNERVALVSLAYQGWINTGKSRKLRAAIVNGDRAEAWFEIRYDTNHETRRYRESDLFSLYNDKAMLEAGGSSDANTADAKAAYRMFTRHRNGFSVPSDGNRTYSSLLDYENKSPPGSATLGVQLQFTPAYNYLTKTYITDKNIGIPVSWDHIYVGEDASSLYYKGMDLDGELYGSTSNDLIFGESGNDTLYGLAGDDILEGGSGNDTLYGGDGSDVRRSYGYGYLPSLVWQVFLIAVVLLSSPPTVLAGEYKLLRHDDPIEGPYSDFVTGVCTAMEENLKRYQDRPYGMACRRELDPALGFTRPKWERLDILKHQELAMAILRYRKWEENLGPDPHPWPERLKHMVEKDSLTMDIVQLDLDRDGKPDNLVRFGFDRPCDPKELAEKGVSSGGGRRFFVIDSTLTKVDLFTSKGVSIAPPDADVFLFKGIVYTDIFGAMPLSARPHAKNDGILWISEFSKHGLAKICTYHYFDSSASSGGK